MSFSVEVNCFHCGAKVSPREAADGWCDSCGKRLPISVQLEAKRSKGTVGLPHRGGSSPVRPHRRRLLWGAVFLILLAAAVLIALVVRGTIVWNFAG